MNKKLKMWAYKKGWSSIHPDYNNWEIFSKEKVKQIIKYTFERKADTEHKMLAMTNGKKYLGNDHLYLWEKILEKRFPEEREMENLVKEAERELNNNFKESNSNFRVVIDYYCFKRCHEEIVYTLYYNKDFGKERI